MSKFPDFIMKIFINLENVWELARASWEEIFLEPVLWQKKCSKFRKIWEKKFSNYEAWRVWAEPAQDTHVKLISDWGDI